MRSYTLKLMPVLFVLSGCRPASFSLPIFKVYDFLVLEKYWATAGGSFSFRMANINPAAAKKLETVLTAKCFIVPGT